MSIVNVNVSFLGKEHVFKLILDNEELNGLDYEQVEDIIKKTVIEQMTVSWKEQKLPVLT